MVPSFSWGKAVLRSYSALVIYFQKCSGQLGTQSDLHGNTWELHYHQQFVSWLLNSTAARWKTGNEDGAGPIVQDTKKLLDRNHPKPYPAAMKAPRMMVRTLTMMSEENCFLSWTHGQTEAQTGREGKEEEREIGIIFKQTETDAANSFIAEV